ncbi:MAG: HEAT repeat domain-containing protein, partial [Bacteroidota bacterium]
MKYAHFVVIALLAVSFAVAGMPEGNTTVNWEKAEQNYIVALQSTNSGVRASAALQIRKYHLTGTVDELTELLTEEKAENVKMSVALALISVGGQQGRNAVEQALKTEESELVAEFYRTILTAPVT